MHEFIVLKVAIRDGKASFDGSIIVDAKAVCDRQYRFWLVGMVMHDEGSRVQCTADDIGSHVAMTMDGKVCSYPMVNDEVTDGKFIISGNFTEDEAKEIAILLKSGMLPVPLHVMKVLTVEKNAKE